MDQRNKNYCVFCNSALTEPVCQNCSRVQPSSFEEEIITIYFIKGYPYRTILKFLHKHHKSKMSLRTLKTKLKIFGLARRNVMDQNTAQKFEEAIRKELSGPSINSGYRTIWRRLAFYHGVFVPRDAVMYTLQQIDPEGSNNRRACKLKRREYGNAGANSCWHVDDYDKLKSFGFPIHGWINGSSHKIIWLKTVHSNNNPFIIVAIFLEYLKQYEGCPSRICTYCGSGNVFLVAIQSYLRRNHPDEYGGLKFHVFGTSHGIQRIESW